MGVEERRIYFDPPPPHTNLFAVVVIQETKSFTFTNNTRYLTKEYVLVIEGTAQAIVFQRCDSPNLYPPALSDSQVVDGVYCRQSGERLVVNHYLFNNTQR